MTPDLLGCGQENEQVDDAVLQSVEVLQGKGEDVLPCVARPGQSPPERLSPFRLGTQGASGQRWEPALSEPALMEGAGYQLRE